MTDRTASRSGRARGGVREAVERRRDDLVDAAAGARPAAEHARRRGRGSRTWSSGGSATRGSRSSASSPDAEAALADPYAGYPFLSYEGRSSVVGRLAGLGRRPLAAPQRPHRRRAGRARRSVGARPVVGRGRGRPPVGPRRGRHEGRRSPRTSIAAGRGRRDRATTAAATCSSRSVIEEECGGNGMWSVLRAGHDGRRGAGRRADRAPPRRTPYTGVVWARLVAPGGAGHSMLAGGEGAFDRLVPGGDRRCARSRRRSTSRSATRSSPPCASGRTG